MENETAREKSAAKSPEIFKRLRNLLPFGGKFTGIGERKPWYKLPLAKRIAYLVLSLLLAMLLWGYVLMTKNPDRTKVFGNIAVSFESGSEADLLARKYTVYGDPAEILKNVSVTVSAPLTEISKISDKNITATVSLNDIRDAGTYTLEIKAVSTIGTVVDVSPDKIEVTIDKLRSRAIPISYDFVGELPEGYWHDTPVLMTTVATVEGAQKDVAQVASAVCHIDLNNVISSINRSIPLEVLDQQGNEMDSSLFTNVIPAVTVEMTVLPHRHIPVVYEIADADQLPDIFEIQSESLNYEYLDIAAEGGALAELAQITAEPIYMGRVGDTGTYTYELRLQGIPADSYIINGADPNGVRLSVVVGEKNISQTFTEIPILFRGEGENFIYRYSQRTVTVYVSGPARAVQNFVTSSLNVILNVEGRGPGEYELYLEFSFTDPDLYADLEIEFETPTVFVTISSSAGTM
ncbi:MAG: hypothetical protein K6G56_09345 [Clostridiales bacterium]|nr:hypothetical protein [Clostridiales bacterium]